MLRFHLPPGGAGSITRYYHFLFDQLWPCFELLASGRLQRNTRIFIERVGPFVDWLPQALDADVELYDPADGVPEGTPTLDVVGKNPKCCRFRPEASRAFAQHLFAAFEVPETRDGPRVLMIERGEPDAFFATDAAPAKGGGTTRRSIPNHDQLADALAASYGERFANVELEGLSFREQLTLFRSLDLVIGQHGAGLANALWMQPGRHLVEIRSWHPAFRHFEKMARDHGLAYRAYRVDSHHPVIAPRSFLRFLRWRSLL